MDKQPVGQLPDLTQSNNDDEIMVITNSEYNQLKKEKISDLINDFTSKDENNALTKGTDDKMFVTDFGNASNITEGTLPTSVLPEIPLDKIPDIPKDKLPDIEITDLPASGVTADTYAYPSSVTVNAQGQVTAIEAGEPGANNANQDLSNISEAGKEVIRQNSGAGMPVGTIFAHTCAADFVPENSLPCDGTEYTQTQFPTFYNDWLVGVRLNTCTYEEYQSDIDNYGKCVKFGLDTASGKFKVPTIPDGTHIQQAMTDGELGKSYNAGLPNVKGSLTGIFAHPSPSADGCVNIESSNENNLAGSTDPYKEKNISININASDSSPIYKDDVTTVQTESVAVRFFVVVATGAINQSEMDWSNWASSLQGKLNVDCSNLSEAGKKVFDGQWVSIEATTLSSIKTGTSTVDLSEHLPSDNNNYEIMLLCALDAVNGVVAFISSEILPNKIRVCSPESQRSLNTVNFPIGQNRELTIEISGTANNASFVMYGYRRLGTNE